MTEFYHSDKLPVINCIYGRINCGTNLLISEMIYRISDSIFTRRGTRKPSAVNRSKRTYLETSVEDRLLGVIFPPLEKDYKLENGHVLHKAC